MAGSQRLRRNSKIAKLFTKAYFSRMRGSARAKTRPPVTELIFSWFGGFCGILAIWFVNRLIGIQESESLYLIGSFGASAVLIYGAPAGPFSQPRNVIGGHAVSAATGVACQMLLPGQTALAGACAVGTAIVLMLVTETVHPPGGATSLIAVISGSAVHDLGFWYVLSPVTVGSVIMCLVAVCINNLSRNPARHYPKYWF